MQRLWEAAVDPIRPVEQEMLQKFLAWRKRTMDKMMGKKSADG